MSGNIKCPYLIYVIDVVISFKIKNNIEMNNFGQNVFKRLQYLDN